jgi:threonine dehydratase
MNFDRLRFVCERSRIGEGKECLLSCKVEEKPGSFMKLYLKILPRSMTEVSYRFSHPSEAHIYLAFEVTRGKQEMQEVIENINHDPAMEALDITENDVAKSHLRFLAGGRTVKNSIKNEKLYRFSFPERPGALKLFLEMLQDTNKLPRSSAWNLTLIHYRNTGGDVARVLIGMDVPKESETSGELAKFLQQFGYSYVDETKNPVYDYFLQ